MEQGICIGSVPIRGALGLAPMAGFTDLAFRAVCRELGCGYTVTEMVSAKALCFQDGKTREIAALSPGEHPAAVQIFGSEPEIMARGAVLALAASGADVLDINMGCPAGRIVSNGEGSALLKDLDRAAAVISAVRKAVSRPVTVKFRSGWDGKSVVAEEFARMAEACGADGLCIHGRTSRQLFSGRADRAVMARVVAAVKIPVMVNGDVTDRASARALLEETGASFALVGRGALGNPWIFSGDGAPPSVAERLRVFLHQAELAAAQKGERRAMAESRAHLCRYLAGFRGAAGFRSEAVRIASLDEARALAARILAELGTEAGPSSGGPR